MASWKRFPRASNRGPPVEKGQVLAKLRNMPLESSILQLEGEREILLERLAGRASMKLADNPAERAAAQRDIAAIQKRLESVNSQLVVQREDLERLTIRAPRDGVIIPPEIVPQPKSGQDDLPKWWGTPFNERNRGATLQTGTKLCSIGDPTKLEARLLIEQSRSSEVQANQEVLVQLQQSPWHRYRTKIVDTEGDEIPVAPSRLSSMTGGPLPTEMNDAGVPVPLTPHFYAFAPAAQRWRAAACRLGRQRQNHHPAQNTLPTPGELRRPDVQLRAVTPIAFNSRGGGEAFLWPVCFETHNANGSTSRPR